VKNDPVVAIAGVTGAVGAKFIAAMDKRGFRVGKLKALASARSVGKTIGFRGESIEIEELGANSFKGVDIALFSAGSGTHQVRMTFWSAAFATISAIPPVTPSRFSPRRTSC